jgi:hypothetical protein
MYCSALFLAFGIGLWSVAFGLWPLALAFGIGLWPLAFGLWPLVCGLLPLAFGLWPLAFGLWPLTLAFAVARHPGASRDPCFRFRLRFLLSKEQKQQQNGSRLSPG